MNSRLVTLSILLLSPYKNSVYYLVNR